LPAAVEAVAAEVFMEAGSVPAVFTAAACAQPTFAEVLFMPDAFTAVAAIVSPEDLGPRIP
jgi:hypothetical protein